MNASMMFCQHCGKEIHASAIACPSCGGRVAATTTQDGLWMSITSLVIGIVCVLALFDDSAWDTDQSAGAFVIAVTGVVFGSISLSKRKSGKNMAIAGVVMSALGILLALGKFPN